MVHVRLAEKVLLLAGYRHNGRLGEYNKTKWPIPVEGAATALLCEGWYRAESTAHKERRLCTGGVSNHRDRALTKILIKAYELKAHETASADILIGLQSSF